MTEILSDLTVVIATLPRNYPREWVDQIKSYILHGVTVMFILPSGYTIDDLPDSLCKITDVQINIADGKGQVTQRIYGFCRAATTYVMQMDDDIYLEINDLIGLINAFQYMEDSSALAPRLIAKEVYKSLHCNPDWRSIPGIYRNLSARIIHGLPWFKSPYGCITPSGYGYTYPSNFYCDGPARAEWLPGGCILHRRKNLILEPFYPFQGKAFVEDLIHSFYLNQQGIRLYYFLSITALTPAPDIIKVDENPGEIFSDFNARRFYVDLSGGSLERMRFIYILKALKVAVSLMLSTLKK